MIDVTIHSTGTGSCSLSGKEGPGLTVTFKDGTVTNAFLSWKSLQQLVAMKTVAHGAGKPVTTGTGTTANGQTVSESKTVTTAVPVAEAKK